MNPRSNLNEQGEESSGLQKIIFPISQSSEDFYHARKSTLINIVTLF